MRFITTIAALMFSLVQGIYAQQIEPFEKGDRVVFAGNSITEAGLYHNYIWLYYLTRFPERELQVFNGGIGGDVAGQIYDRLEVDLFGKKPTVLVVTFGMNDSKYFEYGDTTKTEQVRKNAVETSLASFRKIEDELKKHQGLRKIIMSSSLYDETMQNKDNYFHGKAATMEAIARFQEETAQRNGWDYVDLLHPMSDITRREQAKKADFTLTGPDRIHPGSAGHFVMAYLFLKDQGMAGKPVAVVDINASEAKVKQTENARVSALKATPEMVSFKYLASALPFPIDTVPRVWQNWQTQKEALEVIPFTEEMNQEILKVAGLKSGMTYELRLNDESMGQFTAQQISSGINLATITSTPQYKQAERLMELNRQHRELENKFRNYYWVNYDFLKEKGLLFDDSEVARDTVMNNQDNIWLKSKTEDYERVRVASTRKKLEQEMAAIRKKLYSQNRPQSIQVTLTAVR